MFNKNLRRIRLQKGLSQKQLADYLCISPQSVSKWEKGEALPSIEYLPILAECLGCDINAFFAPVQEISYDLELLKAFYSFMTEYLYDDTKKAEDFLPFWKAHPDIVDMIAALGEELKQYQIIKVKTLQGILGCSESDALVFIDYFLKQELIEKIGTENSYFVIKSSIDGLRIVLKTLTTLCNVLKES